ncbi:MAG: thiamine phosphate synthase [Muribaculaceae bacterium]|nr:thiamine phosphate synthase [Muribaculaceae bacterium]
MIPTKKVLQFITDGNSAEEIISQIKEVIAGGCFWVQLRMKEFPDNAIEKVIEAVKPLTDEKGVTLIMNDRVDMASRYSLDGVHLGDDDMSVAEARNILGDKALIGVTANTFEDILLKSQESVDYFGIGPYRYTTTKKNLKSVIGLQGYDYIVNAMKETGIDKPAVAIGGIMLEDVNDLMELGLWGVAVSGAITKASDRKEATEKFMKVIEKF